MTENIRYLRTGDVVASPNAKPDDRYVVLGPHPPGGICGIYKSEQGEALGIVGTPAEGVEGLIPTDEHWNKERALRAFARAGFSGAEWEAIVAERYDLPPYEIPK